MAEPSILDELFAHFDRYARPEAFINRSHCDECAEHYETLLHVPVEELTHDHLGDGAWDPSCMLTPDAFRYYFPGLARVAEEDPGWREMLVPRLPLHYTETFTRDDWLLVERLLEHWWLDERMTQFERDGIERGLDACRRALAAP